MNTDRPIDIVAARFEIVHGAPPKMRARCPGHASRTGTLAIKETPTGTVLLRCFAGCTLDQILNAAGLSAGDLFPDGESLRQRDRERFAARQRFAKSPKNAIVESLNKELAQLRASLRVELGYDPPLHARDINEVRRRVRLDLGLKPSALPPVADFPWELWPHSADPAWPALYNRAVEEETRRHWHALNPDANAWETNPDGPGFYDRIRAQHLAREWQRAMAS